MQFLWVFLVYSQFVPTSQNLKHTVYKPTEIPDIINNHLLLNNSLEQILESLLVNQIWVIYPNCLFNDRVNINISLPLTHIHTNSDIADIKGRDPAAAEI